LRHVSEIEVPLGLTPHDAACLSPGPSLVRTFEFVADSEQKDYPKSGEYILCKGAAVGLDESGQCCHYAPGLNFVGFLLGQTENRACVKTRDSIVLKIEGVSDEDQRQPVFCSGPNEFTLDRQQGAVEIGKIRFVENGLAIIAFRRFNDDRPLNLDVRK
jgi:hypothetical protein